jgi:hypothetical protein
LARSSDQLPQPDGEELLLGAAGLTTAPPGAEAAITSCAVWLPVVVPVEVGAD